jgi:hypothetical protein
MAIPINNETELNRILNQVIYNAIDFVMDNIYKENKDLIQKIVYDNYSPKIYNRTYELRDSWTIGLNKRRSSVIGTLEQDWQDMTLDQPNMVHGSNFSLEFGKNDAPNDVREFLVDIIINGNAPLNPHLGKSGGTYSKRDFWTPLLEILDRGQLINWFHQSINSQGFDGIIG